MEMETMVWLVHELIAPGPPVHLSQARAVQCVCFRKQWKEQGLITRTLCKEGEEEE